MKIKGSSPAFLNPLSFLLICSLLFSISNFLSVSYAQDLPENEILKDKKEDLGQVKQTYFDKSQYSEFIDYLKGIRESNPTWVSYYIALTRYTQLQYLEETQKWEEYFNRGEEYRQELIKEIDNALALTRDAGGSLLVYTKCLVWEFHKDMQDDVEEAALQDLLTAVKQYSEAGAIDISVIKYVADKLSNYGERANSLKVYSIYLDKLTASLYKDKESKLIALAKQLAYRDEEISNPFFAEEVFKKVEQVNPGLILDEETQHLRAYNLEKIKQYNESYLQYQVLVRDFPRSSYCAQALFKMGVISAYMLKDISTAVDCFTKLNKEFPMHPNVVASLYQLGLISQYQADALKAKEFYNSLIDKSKEIACCQVLVNNAKSRLEEIEKDQPLEFNLKTFMDASLKTGEAVIYSPDVDVDVQRFRLVPNQSVKVSSLALPQESGCLQVNLEYLWSGDLGDASPGNYEASFTTRYSSPGTKVIMLVVITPSGILGYNLIFLDVAY